jgi:DNA-binding response OmpR family regulator
MKILLVEDDEHTASLISNALTAHHYLVNATKSVHAALALTQTYSYDLILLDVIVPNVDGVNLCRQLRSQGAQMPILMLTGKNSSDDCIEGLEAGADDYVVKPFDLSELVARIRALLRRRQTTFQAILTWDNLQLDLSTCEVTYGEVPLHLTPKEYGLLELFLRNPRRIFNRSALLDNVWKSHEFPGERAVTTQIKGLRQKLKTAGMAADVLETVYGLGYRLRPEPAKSAGNGATIDTGTALPTHVEEEVAAAIEKIWQKLKSSLKETFECFDQTIAQAIAGMSLDPQLRQQAILEAHRLAGNLGSFGLPQGSDLARQIEQLLRANETLCYSKAVQLSEWVESLKQVVAQQRNTQKTSKKLEPQKAFRTAHHLTRLLVVDDDVAIAQQIQAVAESMGFEIAAATNLAQARQVFAQAPFDGVLLDLTFPDTTDTGLTFLEDLTHQIPEVPVVVLTGRDRLTDRVEVARLGGRAFVQKPISPHKLLETVAQVLAQSHDASHKILVVDDDVHVLETLRTLLEPWGLHVTTLNDPQQFWEMLETCTPNLLILDIEMPHFNGIELCQAVRNDPDWGEIPVLFLTAHRDAEMIQRVFMAGADDYVGKPIMAPELLARVLNRLERRQPIRP